MSSLGIYDSGVGGISILQSIRDVFPELAVTYLADRQIMPLGEKTREYIRERVRQAAQYLFDHDCSLVILACNTASVVSIRALQEGWIKTDYAGRRNLLGINVPLIELMKEQYSHLKGKAGVLLTTSAAYDSGYYQNELETSGFKHVRAISSADLASAIEAGDRGRIGTAVARITTDLPIPAKDIEFVILACTHYPFALDQIKKVFPSHSIFIEPGAVVAQKLGDYMRRHPEYAIGNGLHTYLTTGDATRFSKQIETLTGKHFKTSHVDI